MKALERARARIELGRARLTLRAVERAKKLQEQQEAWEWLGGYADIMDRLRSSSRDSSYPFSTAQDRRFGDYWPFWRTWQEHARVRASSRLLYGLSGMASGAIEGIASYVIGEGFTYRVVAKRISDERQLKPLLDACQEVIDDFAVANDWPSWEQEFFIRSRRDGEFFIRSFADDDGCTTIREIEPEQVVEPPGHDRSTTSYGIINDPEDLHTVTGYAIAYDGNSARVEEASPEEVVHLKCNVDRKVKRGLPDLSFDSHDLLRSGGRLLQALAIGSTIQASIAWVRQHDTASGTQIEDFVAGASAYTARDAVSGADVRQQRIEPGTILDIDKGQTFVSSPINAGVPYFTQAFQACMRGLGVRWNAPEWLVSGDASNNNYACHDAETELLTKRGWLRYDEVRVGDVAGTMNPSTGRFEWQGVQAVHVHSHHGPMVKVLGRDIDLLVTTNHRMYTARHVSRRVGGRMVRVGVGAFGFQPADRLRIGDVLPLASRAAESPPVEFFTLPGVVRNHKHAAGARMAPDRTIPMNSFLGYLGWWVAEGWTGNRKKTSHGHVVALSQKTESAEECDSIRASASTLSRSGVAVRERAGRDGMTTWQATDKPLWTWLRNNCGTDSRTKRLPDFVFSLPASQLQILLDSLLLGDGTDHGNGSFHYFTVSRELANQVQAIGVMCGRIANVEPPMRNGVIPVSIRRSDRAIKVGPNHISRVSYSGVVWCATVPNGLLVTRRNGKAVVTGNSSLTAESPFIKTCKRRQKSYSGPYERVMWIVLSNAILARGGVRASGKVYSLQEIKRLLRIVATPPTIEIRDRLGEANANQVRVLGGWKSRQMVAAEEGIDWDQVIADTNAWNDLGGGSPLSDMAVDGFTDDSGGGSGGAGNATAELRATVGGSAAIAALQKSYYAGELPRPAAIANARVVFGFSNEQAEMLFPQVAPVKLTPDAVATDPEVTT